MFLKVFFKLLCFFFIKLFCFFLEVPFLRSQRGQGQTDSRLIYGVAKVNFHFSPLFFLFSSCHSSYFFFGYLLFPFFFLFFFCSVLLPKTPLTNFLTENKQKGKGDSDNTTQNFHCLIHQSGPLHSYKTLSLLNL